MIFTTSNAIFKNVDTFSLPFFSCTVLTFTVKKSARCVCESLEGLVVITGLSCVKDHFTRCIDISNLSETFRLSPQKRGTLRGFKKKKRKGFATTQPQRNET